MNYFNKEQWQDKVNKDFEETSAKANLLSETDVDYQIQIKIRERYSISQEISLLRKKLIGNVNDTKWQEYCTYVNQCISEVESSIHQ